MSARSIQPPYPIFTDIDGQPLEAGYVWIGTANLDPQTNPINVYWDAALTILAPQPIRTLAGYPANNGTPARLYVASDYSVRVMNKNGSVVYSAPVATDVYGGGAINASQVAYDPAGTGAVQRTAQDKFREFVSRNDYNNQSNYEVARNGKFGIDGDNRTWQPYSVVGFKPFGESGDTFPNSSALRDGYTVSRDLTGLTDCHAFADKTVIDQVTDYGGYGTFDATTILRGNHTQNHVFSFQDRTKYEGSGTLQFQTGLYSRPEMTGSGTMQNRFGAHVYDIAKSGLGTVDAQIGVFIDDLSAATNNVAFNSAQSDPGFVFYCPNDGKSVHVGNFTVGAVTTDPNIKLYVVGGSATNTVGLNIAKTNGWSIFAAGTGKNHFAGQVAIGRPNITNSTAQVTVSDITSGEEAFLQVDATGVYHGLIGDLPMCFVTNASQRLRIRDSANGYAVTPGANNSQKLGDATYRWSEVFAISGTINTSDAREKQQVAELTVAEKAVAQKLKGLIRTFKFNEAVERKGDGARIHVGVIAQDVKAAFESEGLDPNRYGIFCHDEWQEDAEEVEAVEGEDGAYSKQVEVQKTETVEVVKTKTEVIGDRVVVVSYTEQVVQPIYKELPVFDEHGNQIKELVTPASAAIVDEEGNTVAPAKEAVYRDAIHEVPVMETVTKYYKKKVNHTAGDLYGIRYEELMAFVIAAM